MFTNVFAKILFIFIICSNLACAGTQLNASEISESQISEGSFEVAVEVENIREKSNNLKDKKTSNLNDEKFRNLKWGMSLEEVLKAEGLGSVNRIGDVAEFGPEYIDDAINFSDVVGGLQTTVYLYFYENKLMGGMYAFQEEHQYKNIYIDDFKNVEKILLDKYGPASSSEIYWRNESWKDSPGYYGHAVALGHLEYKAEWYTYNNIVFHYLVGDGYEIEHLIYYYSEQLKNKIENKRLDKF